MNLFSSIPLVIVSVLVSALIWWLFARQMTAKTLHGRAHPGCRPRLPGVHEPRRRRPHQAHAARHLREVPALRDGARRRASLGAGLRRHHQGSSELVRVRRTATYRFQSLFFSSSMHSMANDMHQVFVSAPRASSSGSGWGGGGGGSAVAEVSPAAASAVVAAARSSRLGH